MNICVVGTGYVGLVTGACLAELGNTVWCIDVDTEKIKLLKEGIIPIYEPGLQDIVIKNIEEKRLYFDTEIENGIRKATICLIAVGTPEGEDGSADVSHVVNVAECIGQNMNHYMLVVNKSTVPVGTADRVRDIITKKLTERQLIDIEFDVVSNPEFLKEGTAVEDFMSPDRIIIGADTPRAIKIMNQLYLPFVSRQNRILVMDIRSAELCKYASNAMLATRISFMNEMAQICDQVGADIMKVRTGMAADQRIGSHFLYPGVGYGGACFPKDVKELIQMGNRHGIQMKVIKAVEEVNKRQAVYFLNKIIKYYNGEIAGKKFAVWGLAFKPQTDDMREAPSISIIRELFRMGAKINVYDPKSMKTAKKIFADLSISYVNNMMDVLEDADALLLITEWRQFRQPDFERIKELMRTPLIFDGRNQFDPEIMRQLGIEYFCIGR